MKTDFLPWGEEGSSTGFWILRACFQVFEKGLGSLKKIKIKGSLTAFNQFDDPG